MEGGAVTQGIDEEGEWASFGINRVACVDR
jgi:hypothetical protein